MKTSMQTPTREAEGTLVVRRLRSLGPCSLGLAGQVKAGLSGAERAEAKAILQVEGDPVARPRYLLSGWACRLRLLRNGRRVIYSFVLPGESVGFSLRPHPTAVSTTVALTPVTLADAAPLFRQVEDGTLPELRFLIQAADDADERRLLETLVRLGHMSALQRTAHLLIDIYDRLTVVEMVREGQFDFPLTQEILSETLGLSLVHTNRTLQDLQRRGLATLRRGLAQVHDVGGLRDLVNQAL